MPVLLAGSIATDHLMHFPGRFSEQLLADQLHQVSLSFLVDDLVVRRGGVAANIAFGMGQLGENPVLVGAVGEDFADYRAWLERHGVDCKSVHISEQLHTARFVCTTDEEMCQIASFYAGAMSEARNIELRPAVERTGAELVVVSADDPAGMVRHSVEARELGYHFAADPSQQIARMSGEELLLLIEGADLLFTNEYEKNLLESKTGLSEAEIQARIGVRVTTQGKNGVKIVGRGMDRVHVPVAKERAKLDPTGVGDGFRAGFLSARTWGLSWERAAQVGSLLATLVLETVGTQEYEVKPADFGDRLAESYGDAAAADVLPFLTA
ncbi:MAG TPA: carbohydrate kinase family protein [Jatrophihabitans sp.]|nr:carbohydrate kinase family protein [Jatrophihabitans sp.]